MQLKNTNNNTNKNWDTNNTANKKNPVKNSKI